MPPPAKPTVIITLHGWAHGGDAVGRLEDGRACFVTGGLPGETVEVTVRKQFKRHATADVVRVVEASPHRVEPPCPYYGSCGGCQLQHAAPDHQLELKARVLHDTLVRIGKEPDPPVRGVVGPEGAWPGGYRAWVRMAVDPSGALGFRRRRSHEVQAIDRCLLLSEAAQQVRDRAGDRWDGATEVTLTAGSDAAVLVAHVEPGRGPDLAGLPDDGVAGLADDGGGPLGVTVDDGTSTSIQREPDHVMMQVDDMTLRASAGAFFQAGPEAAALLVRTVMAVAGIGPGDRVLDLYAGVGLFSVAMARAGAVVTAVESNAAATADAAINVAGLPVTVLTADTAQALSTMRPDDVDLVLLDPPRSGANAEVCHAISALAPRRIVYVACDPAALARDTAILREDGYRLRSVDGLDLFGHTAHVEAVAVYER